MSSLDDTSAMKHIRASGLYITCLKIIKLAINQRYQKYVLDLRKDDYKPRVCLLLQAFAYGGGEGFGTMYNLFQNNWQ
jgi:hypothetical protein